MSDDCLPSMEVYHLLDMVHGPVKTNYTKRWYVPTALTECNTLMHHFAHESFLAARGDHLNFGTCASLWTVLDIG